MGECTTVWLSWLGDVQLMALDETELNYHRIQLDGEAGPLVADDGERPEEFLLCTSRWGVLTDGDGRKSLPRPSLPSSGSSPAVAPGTSWRRGSPCSAGRRSLLPSNSRR